MEDTIKISFEDGSSLEIMPKQDNSKLLDLIMYGIKDIKTVTMTYAQINADQAYKIAEFIKNWADKQTKII
jgi:hypothetical protein